MNHDTLNVLLEQPLALPGSDNNLFRLQDDWCREEREDKHQLLSSLGLARREDTEIGQMINMVEDSLVLSVRFKLQTDIVNLGGNNKNITIFFGKIFNFVGVNEMHLYGLQRTNPCHYVTVNS